ncbi:putative Para-aminobenzoate N-oxygenase AurF [Vibrio crassostreae]|nr:putative Para-aminobenzoate N-oxygenase AurF [Vibrio crassostreae]CAK3798079.1 putative Para-aminobenzoate N-oxygenase AurF [Vibrio crassostreae]HAS3630946.1 diiron oxygenase [Vibrio cholerae]
MLKSAEKSYKKLISISNLERKDFFSDLKWPDEVNQHELWMPERLISIYGTAYYENLTHEQIVSLSKYECVNLFCLNVYGIKSLISLISNVIYKYDNDAFNEYLHCFIDEENKHMWYFHKFCSTYVGKLYSSKFEEITRLDQITNEKEKLLLILTLILTFEMIGDIYNKETFKDITVNAFVREINRWHHEEESRHISFGKISLKELVKEASEEIDKENLTPYIEKIISYTNSLFYNPACYADADLPNYKSFWLEFSVSEKKKQRDEYFLRAVRKFFREIGFDVFSGN